MLTLNAAAMIEEIGSFDQKILNLCSEIAREQCFNVDVKMANGRVKQLVLYLAAQTDQTTI
jgi:hypothetical protein